ncbi:MAG: hypothetical protein ACON49_01730 [Candidatus Puniceispirillaceae bacterium]
MKQYTSKKVIIGAALASACVLTAGLAVAAVKHHKYHDEHGYHHKGGKHGAMMRLHKLDSNDDDAISLSEFHAPAMMRFEALDTDGDGTLSSEEFLARSQSTFARLDDDESGIIELDEWPRRHKKHRDGES